MANMSYCRFYNTLMDLEDCLNTLNGENNGIESKSEMNKAVAMLTLMCEFAIENDLIEASQDGFLEINDEVIQELVEEQYDENA